MKLIFIGTGYVGLVTGACMAELGHDVNCIDIDKQKVAKLKKGKDIFYEPGLPELVKKNVKKGRLNFDTNLGNHTNNVDAIFIAVGTPQAANGSADLRYVKAAAKDIAKNLQKYTVVINKSTVPVGTAKMVADIISKHTDQAFDVASNPEFLREGSAIDDFMKPDRVVVGTNSKKAEKVMRAIYKPLKAKKVFTNIPSAELIKYAANTFLATKLSFINEMATLSEKVGADIDEVAKGIGLDSRIGPKFLQAGFGFGGSCFPKDVSALAHIAKRQKVDSKITKATLRVNKEQRDRFFKKIKSHFKGDLKSKKIAVLGLAFKGNTDDIRESPAIYLCEYLQKQGAKIQAYDPEAMPNAKKELTRVKMCQNINAATKDVDAIVIATEWDDFKNIDLKKIYPKEKGQIIFDGRNLLSKNKAKKSGFDYIAIGK